MFKLSLKRLSSLFYCLIGLVGLLSFFCFQTAPAQAAEKLPDDPAVTITVPGSSGGLVRPGTPVMINGTGFDANDTIMLYTTTSNNPAQCAPNQPGLTPFTPNPTTPSDGAGQFKVAAAWPDNANSPTTSYFICAISQHNKMALSQNPVTVAQNATFTVTPQAVQAGQQITIQGQNWQPPTLLQITVTMTGQTTPIANTTTTPDGGGNFNTQVTIPADAQAGSYTVTILAPANQAMKQTNTITVTSAQATPTPAPSPSVTASPSATATPGTGQGKSNPMTFLSIALGGLGAVLVIVGITMYMSHRS